MLVWSIDKYTQHDYAFTAVHIFTAERRTVQHYIDGCANNKAGYRMSDREVEDLKDRYEGIADKGFKEIASRNVCKPAVTLKWQHYLEGHPRQYCEVQLFVGDHYDDIKQNTPLLDRLVKRIMKALNRHWYYYKMMEPKSVIKTLKVWRGVQFVQKIKFGPYSDYRHVFPIKRKHWQAPELSQEEKSLIDDGTIISAIRVYRARTGRSLWTAKKVCLAYKDRPLSNCERGALVHMDAEERVVQS